MNTDQKIAALNALCEAENGLGMGWQLANVRDDAKRAELQAPIIAGQNAVRALMRDIEAMAITDGDDQAVSADIYGEADYLRKTPAPPITDGEAVYSSRPSA
jgi:hypothetical protein